MTMARRWIPWIVTLPLAAMACGGGSKQGGDDGGAAGPSGPNVAPLVVNAGPAGADAVDVPFVSVTLCVPGTNNCQTIDSVTVDTGSSGVRVISSVLTLSLPQQMATTGDALVECMQFDDGYTWGSVRLADIKIAGEVAAKVPIQIIGDPAFGTVPSDCSSSGRSENTVSDFGSNGLFGINQIVADCGPSCADTTSVQTGAYYSCSGTTCTAVPVAVADQVPNPIASFGTDGNGAIVEFPSIAAAGATSVSGSLVFGFGTQSNNGLGNATVQTVDDNGNFTTVYKGTTLATSFIDSGSNSLAFNDGSIAPCTAAALNEFYCPASTLNLTAQNEGTNGAMAVVSFSVANTETLFDNASYFAFDDLAGTGIDGNTFDWGFPFFFGRNVYVAFDGATTPGGKGPYFAY
jgi:hypothetical protein